MGTIYKNGKKYTSGSKEVLTESISAVDGNCLSRKDDGLFAEVPGLKIVTLDRTLSSIDIINTFKSYGQHYGIIVGYVVTGYTFVIRYLLGDSGNNFKLLESSVANEYYEVASTNGVAKIVSTSTSAIEQLYYSKCYIFKDAA